MADTLSVVVDALHAATAIEGMAARTTDLTPVWEGAADPTFRGMFREVWETEGASIGRPWAQLSATTLALKARFRRAGKGILRFTDDLMRSLTIRSGAQQLKIVEPTRFTFGTQVPYAHLHQDGWTATSIFGRPRREAVEVPARPFVPDELPPTVLETIEAAMGEYVATGRLA